MFNFNDIDFSGSGLDIRAVKINRPLIAPQKITTTAIEGKDAEVFHRRTSSSYNIDVEFYLFSSTGLQLLSDIRELGGMLDTLEPAKLIFNDESDKYYMAIVEDTEIDRKGRYAIITISFKILDPYVYAITDDTFTYPTTGTKAITRKGNAPSYPLITIKGNSTTAGSFTIGANGSSMIYTGALYTGHKLVIDSTLMTAYTEDLAKKKTSVLNKLDVLDFPVLTKGDNNFTISVAGGATLTECVVKCNSRWK